MTARKVVDAAGLRALRTRNAPEPVKREPPPPAPEHIGRRLKVCGIGAQPSTWCDKLSDDGTYCELIVTDDCKTCQRSGKFRQFLADMNARCPLRKW